MSQRSVLAKTTILQTAFKDLSIEGFLGVDSFTCLVECSLKHFTHVYELLVNSAYVSSSGTFEKLFCTACKAQDISHLFEELTV